LCGLGEDVDIKIYRIIQESLTNVIKHASAKEVHVNIRREPELLTLSIVDDGVGFEVLAVQRGLGLLGMQERVETLNGTFEFESGINQGMNIRIMIPLTKNAEVD
jgi:signal transduction histidine kinase